jgi:hypothetical protein
MTKKSYRKSTRKTKTNKLSKQISRQVKQIINQDIERKSVDTIYSTTAISSTGAIYPITLVGSGTSYNQRIGLSIKPTKLEARFQIFHSLTAPSEQITVRMIHFIDLQQKDGVYPSVNDVLYAPTVYNPINWLNNKRFRLLSDRIIVTNQYKQTVSIKQLYKLSVDTRYSSTGTTDITKNGIYMLLLSDQGLYYPFITGFNRLYYTDA